MANQKPQNTDKLQQVANAVVNNKKRERPDRTTQLDDGDNTKYINHSLEVMQLGKIDMSDNEQVEQRAIDYLVLCSKNDMKPTIAGFALALGIDRKCLWEYRTGVIGKNNEVRNTLKKYSTFINAQMEDYMQNGKINPVAGIFLMKNNFDYADKQEVTVKAETPLGDTKDTKQLEDRYKDSVVVEPDGTTIINE